MSQFRIIRKWISNAASTTQRRRLAAASVFSLSTIVSAEATYHFTRLGDTVRGSVVEPPQSDKTLVTIANFTRKSPDATPRPGENLTYVSLPHLPVTYLVSEPARTYSHWPILFPVEQSQVEFRELSPARETSRQSPSSHLSGGPNS